MIALAVVVALAPLALAPGHDVAPPTEVQRQLLHAAIDQTAPAGDEDQQLLDDTEVASPLGEDEQLPEDEHIDESAPPDAEEDLLQAASHSERASGATSGARSTGGVLWKGTFEEERWTSAFGATGAGRLSSTAVRPAPSGGRGDALRISNPGGGTRGDRWGYDGRFEFAAAGFGSQDDLYFRYYVWFPHDYEWDTQGKMPGLQGVLPGTSPWVASNSIRCPRGSRYAGEACRNPATISARTMWKNGGMITYLGAASIGGRNADDVRNSSGDYYAFSYRYEDADGDDLEFKPGWNYVEQHVKLNTPGREDGVFEGWINGVRGIRLTEVQWRDRDHRDLELTQWNLAHFWGGPPQDYPQEATSVYYDDFVISRSPIGPR